jgi:hypothetical protein
LKLCRGTEAFRGKGTLAEWTKRQAFGHFVFALRAGCRGRGISALGTISLFPAASVFSPPERLAPRPSLLVDSLSHRTLSRKQTKLSPGCWKSLGTKARQRG